MRIIGFLETLTAVAADPERWDEVSTGMLAFRVAIDALEHGHLEMASYRMAAHAARRLPDMPTNRQLQFIIDAAAPDSRRHPDWRLMLVRRLHGYGLHLHSHGMLACAIDVFALVATTDAADDELRLHAMHRKAFALRLLSRLSDAETEYLFLESIARQCGDRRMQLEAELGLAKVTIDRGNIPEAIPLVESVVEKARAWQKNDILAKALVDRAAIAGIRRQPAHVLECSDEALPWIADPTDRDRTLVNMAFAFRELEHPLAARALARMLSRSAVDADQRIAATILSYHIAVDAEDYEHAAHCRSALADVPLSPAFSAEYYEAMAYEAARRTPQDATQHDVAIAAAHRMASIAQEHRLNEIAERAERALRDIRAGRLPAMHEFRPETTPIAEQSIARIERSVMALCSA